MQGPTSGEAVKKWEGNGLPILFVRGIQREMGSRRRVINEEGLRIRLKFVCHFRARAESK